MPRAVHCSRDVAMKMSRRRNGDGVDAVLHQSVGVAESATAQRLDDGIASLLVWIGDPD